ncbi:MAG: AraC family transcriptional regulator [Minicystis sp.]
MADENEGPLLRGVGVGRREAAPPWRIEVGARQGPSIHVVVRGSFYLAEDEHRALPLGPGDIVLVGGGGQGTATRIHCVAGAAGARAAQEETAELVSAAYAFTRAPDRGLAFLAPVVLLGAAEVRREPGLAAIVGLLRDALRDASASKERLARSLLDPLFAYVLHAHDRAEAGAASPDEHVARALQRMREQLAERWTVESLAKAAGLSRAAFARRFLAEMKVSPLRYLADLRMERAAQLLAEGDASLSRIAAEVGYVSEFAFSRAFKRHTGEAPGVFRRRCQPQGASFRMPPVRAAA